MSIIFPKDTTLELDSLFTMRENGCEGRAVLKGRVEKGSGAASGKLDVHGCSREGLLTGTFSLTPRKQ